VPWSLAFRRLLTTRVYFSIKAVINNKTYSSQSLEITMTERDERLIQLARMVYTGEAREKEIISPDILWHVPGHNPVSGDYRGRDYFEVMPTRMAPLDRWELMVERVMVNGDYVVTQMHLTGERKGKTVDTGGGHILRFDDHDQIVEGWGFTEHQDALDEFFAA
jgi:uncharacterized protein